MSDISNFEVISEHECRGLLARQSIGRVAFVGAVGYPVVLPVNYLIDGDVIAFRTAEGEKFESIPMQQVAFQVDGFDRESRTGWSVLAQGVGQDITDSAGVRNESLRRRAFSTWAPGEKSLWLAIHVRQVSGRRVLSINDPTCSWFETYDWQTYGTAPLPG